jgi:uncharacterized membrane protein YuzA (DUF378 family)
MCDKKNLLQLVAFILVVIGALNWGLVGLFGLNVVNVVLGSIEIVERIVYVLVGVAAIVLIIPPAKEGAKKEEKQAQPPAQPPMAPPQT